MQVHRKIVASSAGSRDGFIYILLSFYSLRILLTPTFDKEPSFLKKRFYHQQNEKPLKQLMFQGLYLARPGGLEPSAF